MITLKEIPEDLEQRRNTSQMTRFISQLSSISINSNNSNYLLTEHCIPMQSKAKNKTMSCYASKLLTELLPPLPVLPKISNSTQNTNERKLNCSKKVSRSSCKKTSIQSNSSIDTTSSTSTDNSIPCSKVKNENYYTKNCHNISHFQTVNKFITEFLGPCNSYINTNFKLRIEEYEEVINRMENKKPPKIPHGDIKQLPIINRSCSKNSLCI